jgi:eukaryotic-like serine/threonine-protein kinase
MSLQSASDRKFAAGDVIETTQRYRIVRLHATGFGSIYVARDEFLGRDVLLKSLGSEQANRPEWRSRFLLEGWIMGNLEHPGIVAVYSLGETQSACPFDVRPPSSGETLRSLIVRFHGNDPPKRDRAERRLALRRLLSHLIDVCNAIAFAHDRGAIHCDIKPDSVVVGKFGETLVVEWALARLLDGSRLDKNQAASPMRRVYASVDVAAHTGCTIGTPAYMSPEQATGRQDLMGPASDVFGLGATLYEILTGKPPYTGARIAEILPCAQRCEYPRPRKVNRTVAPALEAICMKAMARTPEDRYDSAMALAEDIERWLAGVRVLAYRKRLFAELVHWARPKSRRPDQLG